MKSSKGTDGGAPPMHKILCTMPSAPEDDACADHEDKDVPPSTGVQLQTERTLPNRQGSFQTLKLSRRSPSITPAFCVGRGPLQLPLPSSMPSNEVTLLLAKFATYWILPRSGENYNASSSICPELFAGIIARRVGFDALLDASVTYASDILAASMTRNPTAADVASKSNGTVLRNLSEALGPEWRCSEDRQRTDVIVLSVALLAHAEYFRGLSAGFHRFHAVALCDLLKVLWTSGHWGELEELAMRSVVVQEITDSISLGRASVLDDPLRLEAKALSALQPSDDVDQATEYVFEQFIHLPRLIRDLRRICSKPEDKEGFIQDTLAAAIEIYNSPNNDFVDAVIRASTTPFHRPDCPDSIPSPVCPTAFTTQRIFTLSVFRNATLILLIAILHRLSSFIPNTPNDLLPSLDIRPATDILSTVPFALDPILPGHRYRAIRLPIPLMVAYSTFRRLEQRSEGNPTLLEYARNMQHYCMQSLSRVREVWNGGMGIKEKEVWDKERLDRFADGLVGGEALRGASKRSVALSGGVMDDVSI